jgi:hypothetical protein
MNTALVEKLFVGLLQYHSIHVNSSYRHEPEESRHARIHMVAEAAISVCEEKPIPGWPLAGCAALVATTAKWESGFLIEIHSGAKRGPAGERCLMQLHRQVVRIPIPAFAITQAEWEDTEGVSLEQTTKCLRLGARILRYHITRCRIPFQNGSEVPARFVYAEYHHPSTQRRTAKRHDKFVCDGGMISNNAAARADSYFLLLRRLRGTP